MNIEHIGVSKLRNANRENMKAANDAETVAIIHDRAEPIAAMVSYKLFMKWQTILKSLEPEVKNGQ